MPLLLEVGAIIFVGGGLILFGLVKWVEREHPNWRNPVAFILALGAAYAASFALNMFVGALAGVYSFSPLTLPVFTWAVIAFILFVLSRHLRPQNRWICAAFYLIGGIAVFAGLLSPARYNILVGIPLMLFALVLASANARSLGGVAMTPELPNEPTSPTEHQPTRKKYTKEEIERAMREFEKVLAEPSTSLFGEVRELLRDYWRLRMPRDAAYLISAVVLLLPFYFFVAFLTRRGFNTMGFYFGLLLFALIFHLLWRKLISPVNGFLFARREAVSKPSNSMILVNFLWLLCQTYFLLGWSAFAEEFTSYHSGFPGVSQHWAYWLWGFMLCTAPVSDTFDRIKNNTFWIAGASFVVFALWRAAAAPWEWFVAPILRFVEVQTNS